MAGRTVRKKEPVKKEIPKYCYVCGREILPVDGEPVYIRTKRSSELWIHKAYMMGGREA